MLHCEQPWPDGHHAITLSAFDIETAASAHPQRQALPRTAAGRTLLRTAHIEVALRGCSIGERRGFQTHVMRLPQTMKSTLHAAPALTK